MKPSHNDQRAEVAAARQRRAELPGTDTNQIGVIRIHFVAGLWESGPAGLSKHRRFRGRLQSGITRTWCELVVRAAAQRSGPRRRYDRTNWAYEPAAASLSGSNPYSRISARARSAVQPSRSIRYTAHIAPVRSRPAKQ